MFSSKIYPFPHTKNNSKGFKWVKNASKCRKDFVENYNKVSDEGCFLEVDGQCPEKLQDLHFYLSFFPGRIKLEKAKKYVANLHDKKVCYTHTSFKTSTKAWISIENA